MGLNYLPILRFYFHRGPGLNSGVRVDPFIKKSSKEAIYTIVLVNEMNKPIFLPRYEIIGTLGFCRIEKDNINSFAECELSSSAVDFANNLPPDMSGVDRTSITNFLIDRKSIFASTTGELGKTGLVKHHINTEGQGPIRLRPYRIHQNVKPELDRLASYYRRFIKTFADIAHPLIELTKKKKDRDNHNKKVKKILREQDAGDATFTWGEAEQKAFETLRECLITPPVVAFPDFDEEFLIFTDASNYGIGAVLSQIQDVKEVVIAYSSRHLNAAERNYSAIEREALAIVYGIKRYRHYLQDDKFEIISDHRPLQWLETHKDEKSRLGRWAIELSAVKYKITNKPGKAHANADFLSRIRVVTAEERTDFTDNIIATKR
ncbi:Uncharacterized protein APZ42_013703 [Daphnia magna]|uniref:Reverse transcriptase RNase H-like domain-containing protein n=1 Tax=Daphnia magna TaxID=35525 RepID=A0A162QS19_9CRUS|nr:Uncharacterized protein APZ42_013703 [Daphnia magna]